MSLPELPTARSVSTGSLSREAIINASRHSTGTSAHIRLEVIDKALHVIVEDSGDAADSSQAWVAGVGVQSMRERAAETGGTLTCGPTPHGGNVEAVLPITR